MSKRILISDGNDQKNEDIRYQTSSLSGWTNKNSFDHKFAKNVLT